MSRCWKTLAQLLLCDRFSSDSSTTADCFWVITGFNYAVVASGRRLRCLQYNYAVFSFLSDACGWQKPDDTNKLARLAAKYAHVTSRPLADRIVKIYRRDIYHGNSYMDKNGKSILCLKWLKMHFIHWTHLIHESYFTPGFAGLAIKSVVVAGLINDCDMDHRVFRNSAHAPRCTCSP